MNQKSRNNPAFIESTCDKYLNRLLRQEQQNNKTKPDTVQQKQHKSATKTTNFLMNQQHSPPVKQQNNKRSSCKSLSDEFEKITLTTKHKSETWKHLLSGNRINYIDPLRTLDSLLRELKFKLENTLSGDNQIHEMVSDVQHVLKRIPPEIVTKMNLPLNSDKARKSLKMLEKSCQTPPNLNQEDTEKLRKIMEESSLKLETTCRQLESLCVNLQNENALIEKQLKNERDNVKILEKKVKKLETEHQNMNYGKFKQLEDENKKLHNEIQQLTTANQTHQTTNFNLKQVINDLEKHKLLNEQQYFQLNYDLTLSNMEKEKYLTMLTIRDREMKALREEMMKLHDQINQNFTNLNTEMVSLVPSIKNISQIKESLGVGDSISSITTDYSVNQIAAKQAPI